MATELHTAIVTIPAGTLQNAPASFDVSFNPMITERIRWRVPRGATGLMGWRLISGTGQVVPKTLGAWVIADGSSGTWQLDELHDSGNWQLLGYNTGIYPHSVHLEFYTRPIDTAARARRRHALAVVGVFASPDLTLLPPEAFAHRHPWAR